MIAGAALLAAGGPVIASPASSQAGAYLTNRNLALAVLLVTLLFAGPARLLAAAVLITAVMHLVDAGSDFRFGNLPALIGSVVFGILYLAAAVWLFGQRGNVVRPKRPASHDSSTAGADRRQEHTTRPLSGS